MACETVTDFRQWRNGCPTRRHCGKGPVPPLNGAAPMSDTNTTPTTLDLLTQCMNDLAQEIGQLDPDHPLWAERIKELHTLREIIDTFKTERNKIVHERMD